MKIRILTLFCALLMVLGALPVVAVADDRTLSVTVNGSQMTFPVGSTLGLLLVNEPELTFLYAEVTENGQTTVTADRDLPLSDGMSVTLHRVRLSTAAGGELRRVSPTGLRFVTSLNKQDLAALTASAGIASVTLGTLILPLNTAVSPAGLTHEGMGETSYLDVPATVGKWYGEDAQNYLFAGSIVEIKDENLSREFAGCGYLCVTLTGGERFTAYAQASVGAFGPLANAWAENSDNGIGRTEREFFAGLARKMFKTDLNGLNVLAIGDSLFDGDYIPGNLQWIGLLSGICSWSFTNLGRDGWTVAYNPGAYADPTKVRSSMYDHLMNDPTYKFGGNGSYFANRPSGKDPEEVDLILMEGGANDYGWGIPLGTVDSEDPGTLLGAWNLMIEKLLVDYPNAKIVLVTSWHLTGTRDDGAERMDFMADGMKSIYETHYAEHERVVLIDGGNPSVTGIDMQNAAFRQHFAKDSHHLNGAGMEKMANAMLPLIWEVYTVG